MSATATLPAPDLSHISDSTRTCPTANLTGAILVAANLSHAYLENAYLGDADLSNAILANAVGLSSSSGAALYDINTDFTGTGFDPVAAGWTLVPEPNTALLLSLGLTGLTGLTGLAAKGRRRA